MATGIVLGVLALGVLLAVVLLLRRSARDTLLPFGGDPRPAWIRRHGLSAVEADDVSRGVARGRAFDDSRLRAAAAEWAAILLRTETPSPQARRFLWVCVVVLPALAVVQILLVGPSGVGGLVWAVFGIWAWRRRRNLQRAIEVNREVVPRD